MGMSLLELRHIIESGFLPIKCRCSVDQNGDLTIELVDPSAGTNLVTGGIPLTSLQTSRDIANLIGELKAELCSSSSQTERVRAS